jgi:putative membrane protein
MKKTLLSISIIAATYCSGQNLSKNDMQFAKETAEAGLLEVKLGELALSKASSSDVKNLGQHMVTDHTKANNELMALATTKKITLPTVVSKEGQKHYDELSQKSGEDFDKAYSQLMVKDHEKVIDKFKSETKSGTDSDLKKWASNTLPTLEHHLMMAKDTEKKVSKTNSKAKMY